MWAGEKIQKQKSIFKAVATEDALFVPVKNAEKINQRYSGKYGTASKVKSGVKSRGYARYTFTVKTSFLVLSSQ
jgi:hypothetical protein